ncbi:MULTISPECIES: DUF742 domain-containing protein [Streptomyces]|jgi:hypothetical protein|uniref:DUF742 domain-containing protein n=1 Tax=Streptomyces thermoviolaceus subsp. thermoviolaceus TaxID=66860 RepID=A0ABX0YZ64_STRTL|nr:MULTISPECIES: DUF742 domain-containing protein [Streptomyces]MCM3266073.1 DUF742 domain-containing protein [Streptomyces thermoviolaceus]NJP16280.1 DUF742 domain-containing protein [Streptomyces thermoviolaceus subsp. thermoviolaceus]RSS08171.1 DUF742 domain-containing protein [Streptomyces sp. WAC00469]WTD50546.1 DUF742 domain-containing protein [Streptomyces thermoviolaceus]GGV82525.1 hypothetical protein GCM10010499_48390 [Streptomyces thermoviolaceus subsp. apingens]
MPDPHGLDGEETGRYLRPYAITGGRTRHSQHAFTLITLVVARSARDTPSGLEPEADRILELCRDRAMAVAEIAALLDLPVSVVKVLCGDLLDASLILVQSPPGQDSRPSVELIERVMDGIRQL